MEAGSDTRPAAPPCSQQCPRNLNETLRASLGKGAWAVAAVPGITFTAVVGRWTPPGLALALGLGVLMSLFSVTLLVPMLLLRPRRYEDMPRSAFTSVLVAPMVLFVGSAVALVQWQRDKIGRATCTAWVTNVCNVLCLAWSIFRDRFMSD